MKLIMSFLLLLMSIPTFSASISAKLDRSKRYIGRIQNFYLDRGYGFIVIENYQHNIFVHLSWARSIIYNNLPCTL